MLQQHERGVQQFCCTNTLRYKNVIITLTLLPKTFIPIRFIELWWAERVSVNYMELIHKTVIIISENKTKWQGDISVPFIFSLCGHMLYYLCVSHCTYRLSPHNILCQICIESDRVICQLSVYYHKQLISLFMNDYGSDLLLIQCVTYSKDHWVTSMAH